MGVTAPSKFQLALALTVVKQKPPGKEVKGTNSSIHELELWFANIQSKDYILEVRRYIKSSKDLGHEGSLDKFFDSVSFWQQAYQQSEARESELHDQVHDLQQRIDGLVTKLRVKDTNDAKSVQANKRKASVTGKGAGGSNVTNKRAKIPSHLKKTYQLMDDSKSGDEDGM